MREFAFSIKASYEKGLRPNSRIGLNAPYLTQSQGAKPSIYGMVPYEAMTQSISDATLTASSITKAFPFPQLIRGRSVTLLATADSIFEVDESDWSLSAVTLSGSITGSGLWHFIDMYDFWYLFNGTDIVYKTNIHSLEGGASTVYAVSTPAIQTGCYHRGRSIMGGLGSDFWSDSWLHILDRWKDALQPNVVVDETLSGNYILWSTIGGGDTLFALRPEILIDGYGKEAEGSIDSPRIMEYFKRNEMGFMPMPWQGTVRVVKPLGKNVIVYGDSGISALIQVTDPASTFGLQHIIDVGIAGRGAVGGTEKEHIFLDNAGFLWRLGVDLKLEKLDYQEYLIDYLDVDMAISYDDIEDEYYICSASDNMILTRKGLGQGVETFSSLYNVAGSLVAIPTTISGRTSSIVVTDSFDLGLRGIKNLSFIDLGIVSTEDIEVAIDYKYNKASAFARTPYVTLNAEGWAYINTSGIEFRLVIKCDDYTKPKITYANVRYKRIDNREVRGLDASTSIT